MRSRRISPSLVISILALVLAVTSSSYASGPVDYVAKTLGLNSKQKKQVTSIVAAQINARAPKLSVLSAKSAISAGSAASAVNATNATNATTAANATNAAKANEANKANEATKASEAESLNGVKIVRGPTEPNPHEEQDSQTVTCPSGMHAIGGGVENDGGIEQSVNETLIVSTGSGTDNAVDGLVNNTSKTQDLTFNTWAICAHANVSG